ncbi:hypothetical protein L1987_45380 [Smallanthus sonchifolius]|uniref:Uncharacterized protein n=1 Tax=Smallanthus sonchifolius TaxID=185202 RepID=A0ACB9GTE9_9ASTR|nr:hypothetical protein L1987_45380 [Smallanthus sonchifolius]
MVTVILTEKMSWLVIKILLVMVMVILTDMPRSICLITIFVDRLEVTSSSKLFSILEKTTIIALFPMSTVKSASEAEGVIFGMMEVVPGAPS